MPASAGASAGFVWNDDQPTKPKACKPPRTAKRRGMAGSCAFPFIAKGRTTLSIGLGFSRVVPVLWSATQLYGTLGSVVLFLIWAYLNSWILLLGGFLLVPRPTEVAG
jgi:Zn-dependent protease